MTWENVEQELSYQRIAELHAEAERDHQVRVAKRRQRGSRRRLGRLLWPIPVVAKADYMVDRSSSQPARRDAMGPSRPNPSLGR